MTLAVVALIIPSAFAFALSSAVSEANEKRIILEMSRGSSVILIFIYITYMIFQLYSHAHYYNPAADHGAKYHSPSSTSSSSSSSDSDSDAEGRSVIARVRRRTRQLTGRSSPDGNEADTEKKEPKEPQPREGVVASPMAEISVVPAPDLEAAPAPKKHRQHRHHHHHNRDATATETPSRPMMPVRRTQSLPFGSAARLGGATHRPPKPSPLAKHTHFDDAQGTTTGLEAAKAELRKRHSPRSKQSSTDIEKAGSQGTVESELEEPEANLTVALCLLLATTGLTYLTAEALTDSLETIGESGTVTPEWLGLILLAVVGNAAEHVTAVFVAYRNKVRYCDSYAAQAAHRL
jgi:Ca2+:H+ antiporter